MRRAARTRRSPCRRSGRQQAGSPHIGQQLVETVRQLARVRHIGYSGSRCDRALGPGRACGASGASRTRCTSGAGGARRTGGAGGTCRTGRARRACRAGQATGTSGPRRTRNAAYAAVAGTAGTAAAFRLIAVVSHREISSLRHRCTACLPCRIRCGVLCRRSPRLIHSMRPNPRPRPMAGKFSQTPGILSGHCCHFSPCVL